MWIFAWCFPRECLSYPHFFKIFFCCSAYVLSISLSSSSLIHSPHPRIRWCPLCLCVCLNSVVFFNFDFFFFFSNFLSLYWRLLEFFHSFLQPIEYLYNYHFKFFSGILLICFISVCVCACVFEGFSSFWSIFLCLLILLNFMCLYGWGKIASFKLEWMVLCVA